MEKCTFCVQRINAGKLCRGRRRRRSPIKDGDVQAACQQACPANAIVFGDLNDPESESPGWQRLRPGVHVLEELNIKPNVTYLARVRNPSRVAARGARGSSSHLSRVRNPSPHGEHAEHTEGPHG